MRELVINTEAKVNAEGQKRCGNAKPVICIDTGVIYTSCTDAAKAMETHPANISLVCLGKQKTAKGKHFCYVKDLPSHLAQLSNSLQNKANTLDKYGDLIAEKEEEEKRRLEEERKEAERKEAERKAEEKRQEKLREDIAKLEVKVERKKILYKRQLERTDMAYCNWNKANKELADLKSQLK